MRVGESFDGSVRMESIQMSGEPSCAGVDAVLLGGPDWFPDEFRHQKVDPSVYALVIQNGNRNEHFIRDWAGDDHVDSVFTWTYFTRVAE